MDDSTCSANPNFCVGPPSDTEGFAQQLAIALSTVSLSTILLFQLDAISRRILSPPRLLAKRRKEYHYAVGQCIEFNTLMIRQHVGGGKGVYDPKMEPLVWEKIRKGDDDEMEKLIVDILVTKKATPVVVAIEQDLMDENDPNEYHLYLAFPPSDDAATPVAPALYRRVRLPLVVFCEMLARAFEERQLTSTALCFVADASSGLGSETLATVAKRCNHGVVSYV